MTALKRDLLQDLALVLFVFCIIAVLAFEENSVELHKSVLAGSFSVCVVMAIGFAVGFYSLSPLRFGILLRRCALVAFLCLAIVLLAPIVEQHLAGTAIAASAVAIGVATMTCSRLIAHAFYKPQKTTHILVVSPEHVLKPFGRSALLPQSQSVVCDDVVVDVEGTVSDNGIEKIKEFARCASAQRLVTLAGGVTMTPMLANALLDATRQGCGVTTLTRCLGDSCGQLSLEDPDTLRVLIHNIRQRSPWIRGVDKFARVVGGLALLLIAALPMGLICLLICAQKDGPVLYRQDRVGLDGRVFTMLKFRTMNTDAEADGEAKWAKEKDPRITRIGAFLRSYRLDELPQLINVLRGEMSLVGPRPERPSIVEDLRQSIPLYDYRHFVRPGITGWAQVNFPYGASLEDAAEKTRYDLYFVQNCSIFLRLLVILQTIRVVIFVEGAR